MVGRPMLKRYRKMLDDVEADIGKRLTDSQVSILRWLSEADSSAYGECRGKDLDVLRTERLAAWDEKTGHPTEDYCRVSLTELGWMVLKQLNKGAAV